MNIKIENYIVIACFALVLVFHVLIFNRYFSLQDGWWETYAYLINQGLKPNENFYLAWTPLFTYISAFYQKIFGINFFIFNLIGIFVAIIQVFVLYKLLCEFFARLNSAICATFASFLWFAMVTYIAKDYHAYVFIIEFSTLLFLVKGIKNQSKIFEILGIFFLLLLFFIKQNIGLLLYASIFVSYAFISQNIKEYIKRISFFLVVSALFFLILNFVMPMDITTITKNDSKGSFITIATRFITEPLLARNLLFAVVLTVTIIFIKKYFECIVNMYDTTIDKISSNVSDFMRYVALIVIVIVIAQIILYVSTKSFYVVCSISIVMYILVATLFLKDTKIFKSKIFIFMVLSITAIVYSGTLTSQVLDMNTLLLCIAFSSCFVLEQNLRKLIRFVVLCWMFITVCFLFFAKVNSPYNWLENYQSSIFEAKSQAKYPQLNGIYMDSKISEILDYFYKYVPNKSVCNDDFYFFNFPIMYLLNDKIPPYYLLTQWFDVVPTTLAKKEFDDFVANPPQNVVLYQYSAFAFKLHESFLGKEHFIQEDIHRQMNKWVEEGKYKFVKSFIVPTKLYENQNIKAGAILQNVDLVGQNYERLRGWIESNDMLLASIERNGTVIYDGDGSNIDYDIEISDVISVQGIRDYVFGFITQIGVMDVDESNYINSINVYERIK